MFKGLAGKHITMDVQELKRRVEEGEQFGPHDDLPEEYKEEAVRLTTYLANSEVMGAFTLRNLIRRAPSHRWRMGYAAKMQDEIGHGQLLYRTLETLGASREELLDDLANGRGGFANIWHYPSFGDRWVDAAMISGVGAPGAIVSQEPLRHSSYKPLGNAWEKITYEEAFHARMGYEILKDFATGTRRQQDLLQERFNWFLPKLLQMFGPPDRDSNHTSTSMEYGLTFKTNDQLRRDFLNRMIPRFEKLGIELPETPRITHDETEETYDVVTEDLDWEEFRSVVKHDIGGSRIQQYREFQEQVEWVRGVLSEAESGHDHTGTASADAPV
jgi:ring-1,2-phenylacetyl-CoA epoxidase subunit PaaA